ncbi:hypothetical protein D3C87_1655230 [compost metagenome]
MTGNCQRPVKEQRRQCGKQHGHHHIAEKMPASCNTQTGHEDDGAGGSAAHEKTPAPLQAVPDKRAERQEKARYERRFPGGKRTV